MRRRFLLVAACVPLLSQFAVADSRSNDFTTGLGTWTSQNVNTAFGDAPPYITYSQGSAQTFSSLSSSNRFYPLGTLGPQLQHLVLAVTNDQQTLDPGQSNVIAPWGQPIDQASGPYRGAGLVYTADTTLGSVDVARNDLHADGKLWIKNDGYLNSFGTAARLRIGFFDSSAPTSPLSVGLITKAQYPEGDGIGIRAGIGKWQADPGVSGEGGNYPANSVGSDDGYITRRTANKFYIDWSAATRTLTTSIYAWTTSTASQGALLLQQSVVLSDAAVERLGNTNVNAFGLAASLDYVANGQIQADLDDANYSFTKTVFEWTANADGTWSSVGNWDGASPNGTANRAYFGAAITASRTVTLDAPKTLAGATFDNASAGYVVAGSSALTLDTASGNAVLSVRKGSHTVSAPVVLNKDLTVDAADGTSLALTGTITTNGKNVVKFGKGTLAVSNLRGSSLNIDEGTVKVTVKPLAQVNDGTSVLTGLTFRGGASAPESTLDLGNGALVLPYTGTSPIADIRSLVASGKTPGNTWTGKGITSSLAAANSNYAVIAAESAELGAITSFAGQSFTGSAVLVRVTLRGDATLDQTVNFDDLLKLAANYNQSTGQLWTGGDFNYDGAVNFDDLLILAANYNQSGVTGSFAGDWALAQSLVPEPATLGLAGGVGLLLSRVRRRRA
jgi:hypothetical protein